MSLFNACLFFILISGWKKRNCSWDFVYDSKVLGLHPCELCVISYGLLVPSFPFPLPTPLLIFPASQIILYICSVQKTNNITGKCFKKWCLIFLLCSLTCILSLADITLNKNKATSLYTCYIDCHSVLSSLGRVAHWCNNEASLEKQPGSSNRVSLFS